MTKTTGCFYFGNVTAATMWCGVLLFGVMCCYCFVDVGCCEGSRVARKGLGLLPKVSGSREGFRVATNELGHYAWQTS